MASEKAKELARQQKEQARAEKLRRKNSTDPRDWGQAKQIWETYKVTAANDKRLPWILGGIIVGSILLFLLIGWFLKMRILFAILGLMLGVLLAMWVFVDRAKKAALKRYEGQAGSAEVALQMLNSKKWSYTPVIAATRNGKSADVIHRALGPGGLILIGEGDPANLKKLLASEKKRHEQIAYGVDVDVIQMGDGEGEVPLTRLTRHIDKLPKKLPEAKITEVKSRLRALDAMRPKMPIPKGPMNVKGARSAMRGR